MKGYKVTVYWRTKKGTETKNVKFINKLAPTKESAYRVTCGMVMCFKKFGEIIGGHVIEHNDDYEYQYDSAQAFMGPPKWKNVDKYFNQKI